MNIKLNKQIDLKKMTRKKGRLDPFDPMCTIAFRTYATYNNPSSLIMRKAPWEGWLYSISSPAVGFTSLNHLILLSDLQAWTIWSRWAVYANGFHYYYRADNKRAEEYKMQSYHRKCCPFLLMASLWLVVAAAVMAVTVPSNSKSAGSQQQTSVHQDINQQHTSPHQV